MSRRTPSIRLHLLCKCSLSHSRFVRVCVWVSEKHYSAECMTWLCQWWWTGDLQRRILCHTAAEWVVIIVPVSSWRRRTKWRVKKKSSKKVQQAKFISLMKGSFAPGLHAWVKQNRVLPASDLMVTVVTESVVSFYKSLNLKERNSPWTVIFLIQAEEQRLQDCQVHVTKQAQKWNSWYTLSKLYADGQVDVQTNLMFCLFLLVHLPPCLEN